MEGTDTPDTVDFVADAAVVVEEAPPALPAPAPEAPLALPAPEPPAPPPLCPVSGNRTLRGSPFDHRFTRVVDGLRHLRASGGRFPEDGGEGPLTAHLVAAKAALLAEVGEAKWKLLWQAAVPIAPIVPIVPDGADAVADDNALVEPTSEDSNPVGLLPSPEVAADLSPADAEAALLAGNEGDDPSPLALPPPSESKKVKKRSRGEWNNE